MEVGLGPGNTVLDGDPPPLPPIFGPCLLWPNGWMDPDATRYGGRPQPRQNCVKWGPTHPQRGRALQKISLAHVYVAKRLDGSRCYLVWR